MGFSAPLPLSGCSFDLVGSLQIPLIKLNMCFGENSCNAASACLSQVVKNGLRIPVKAFNFYIICQFSNKHRIKKNIYDTSPW
jgi:hypothetical protein